MIKHLDGICHTYVDAEADLDIAVRVTENAKTQRYSPCNATETLLVHRAVAFDFLPPMARVFHDHDVEMRCDELSRRIVEQSGRSAVDATRRTGIPSTMPRSFRSALSKVSTGRLTSSTSIPRTTPTPSSRRTSTTAPPLPARGGLELRDGQRLDSLCRRLRIRPRR